MKWGQMWGSIDQAETFAPWALMERVPQLNAGWSQLSGEILSWLANSWGNVTHQISSLSSSQSAFILVFIALCWLSSYLSACLHLYNLFHSITQTLHLDPSVYRPSSVCLWNCLSACLLTSLCLDHRLSDSYTCLISSYVFFFNVSYWLFSVNFIWVSFLSSI